MRIVSILIISVFLLNACTPEAKQKAKSSTVVPISIEGIEGLSSEDIDCLKDPTMICQYGIAIAVLGAPLDATGTMPSTQVIDTLFEQEGYQWRGKQIIFEDKSNILVEGDYVDAGDPASKLATSAINRLRIASSKFQTPLGIKVGSTLAEVMEAHEGVEYRAYYLPDEKMIDISFPDQGRLHYVFADTDNQMGGANPEVFTEISVEEISAHSVVTFIGVFM